jgi:two-component system KDP operon response regulator KdpE
MAERILVVEDEEPLRRFIARNLSARGYEVQTASDGYEALRRFEEQAPDLVILDILLPGLNGLEVLRRIRQASLVPILVLTALDQEADKVTALDLGADDYLTKPFGVGELLARVRAALRRMRWSEGTGGPRILRLTGKEFDLLYLLARHAGRTLSHRFLLQRVWGPEYVDEVEYLRVYIGRLRRKLGETGDHRHLFTEPGFGYRLEG